MAVKLDGAGNYVFPNPACTGGAIAKNWVIALLHEMGHYIGLPHLAGHAIMDGSCVPEPVVYQQIDTDRRN